MKLLVIGHSYLEEENQKNIEALSKVCDICCIVPSYGGVNIWKKKKFNSNSTNGRLFKKLFPIYITKSQFALIGLILSLIKFKPDVINIEYNPWSLQFIQSYILKNLCCSDALIVCSIKKNTFITRSGFIGYIKKIIVNFTKCKVDHYIAVSYKTANLLEETLNIPKQKISVSFQFGVDTNLFIPEGNKVKRNPPFIIGYCGRMDKEKGVSDLVEAIDLLNCHSEIPIELRLLGNGSYKDFLDEQLKIISTNHSWVKLFPSVPNSEVVDFLKKLDIFILPSRIYPDHEEHDGHALMEAMATGIPSIGTNSGIIPEILDDETGRIIKPTNIKLMSLEINNLILNHNNREKFSKNSRKFALENFSLDVIATKKMEIFRRLINE